MPYKDPKKKKENNRKWQKNNSEKVNKKNRKWYRENLETVKAQKKRYYARKIKTDIYFRISHLLRSRLKDVAIKGNFKSGSAIKDLGCSIEYFKQYIENQFQAGMSWENWSRIGWHIDHQISLSVVDLTDREDLKHVCHYTNLQPMWASDNISKGNKINRK